MYLFLFPMNEPIRQKVKSWEQRQKFHVNSSKLIKCSKRLMGLKYVTWDTKSEIIYRNIRIMESKRLDSRCVLVIPLCLNTYSVNTRAEKRTLCCSLTNLLKTLGS